MEGPRVFLFIVLLLFIFLTPDQPSGRQQRYNAKEVEQQRRLEFDVLTNSSLGDLDPRAGKWLDLTGFREHDGYQWELLGPAKDLSRRQFENAWKDIDSPSVHPPVYDQITGEIRGKFRRSDLSSGTAPRINLTALDPSNDYFSPIFERNITETDGELSLSLYDSHAPDHPADRDIRADIAIWSQSAPGNGWQAKVQGVHLSSGVVILSTTSGKYKALPAIPHFAFDLSQFNSSRQVMNRTISGSEGAVAEDVSDAFFGLSVCELIVWLQPKPVSLDGLDAQQTSTFLHQVEEELKDPQGAPIGPSPPMAFSAVVFSPDCGYVLEADTLFGPKIEVYWKLAHRLLLSFILIMGLQIALLKRQMERATTPSTRSRIAYQSIVISALGDGLILFVLIALLMLDEAAFLMTAAAAFLACIHVAFLEVKFIFDIWTVQVGDPARAEQERRRRASPPTPSPPAPAASAEGTTGLPLPATAPRVEGASPMMVPSDQETPVPVEPPSPQASFAAIYSRFYFSLVVLMFFSLWAMTWPRALRSAYANLLIFCYFSFWWPQIYRNAMRNCRKAVGWEYVLGTSILRTVPILYWYFDKRNLLSIDPSPGTAFILLGWLWLQVSILASQQFLGPRLLVRDSWCPPAYDYHPLLREDDVEAGGMSIGLLASASEAKDKDNKTRRVFDCAICMNEIDVPVLSKTDGFGRGASWLEQKNYMVTPCRHIFHAECLEGWMNLRLACPVCRESLPPL